MEFPKKNSVIQKLMITGYSEDNAQDELYLMQALRAVDQLEEFKDICRSWAKRRGCLQCRP
jgi:hypothetical protein